MLFPRIEFDSTEFVPGEWVQIITSDWVYYARYWPSSKIPRISGAIKRKLKDTEQKLELDMFVGVPCINRLKKEISTLFVGYAVRAGCVVQHPSGEAYFNVVDAIADNSKSPDCIITRNTVISVVPELLDGQEADTDLASSKELDECQLLEHKSEIEEMIKTILFCGGKLKEIGIDPPKGLILYGEPGVGKTSTVIEIAKRYNVKLFSVNPFEIHGGSKGSGEERLRLIFKAAEEEALAKKRPSLILIDELDAIAPSREVDPSSSAMVAQLLTLMDGLRDRGQLIVVGTTNRVNTIDPALRRPGRFDREVNVKVPNASQRLLILKKLLRNIPVVDSFDLVQFADDLKGYVLADLAAIVRESCWNATIAGNDSLSQKDFFVGLNKVGKPAILRESAIQLENLSWDDVAGINQIKSRLIQAIEWPLKQKETFEKFGLTAPKGILLYGPPGCSKTTIAKILGSTCGYQFFSTSGAALYSSAVGESEAILRSLFVRARTASPSIIFLDEVESLVGKRELSGKSAGDSVQERILSTMLNEMDGIECSRDVLVIGATNRPDMIDHALLRPGRFEPVIYVPAPNLEARAEILNLFIGKMTDATESIDIRALAEKTEYFTGADLKGVCREAALLKLRSSDRNPTLSQDYFEKAIEDFKPTLSVEMLEQYSKFESLYGK